MKTINETNESNIVKDDDEFLKMAPREASDFETSRSEFTDEVYKNMN